MPAYPIAFTIFILALSGKPVGDIYLNVVSFLDRSSSVVGKKEGGGAEYFVRVTSLAQWFFVVVVVRFVIVIRLTAL